MKENKGMPIAEADYPASTLQVLFNKGTYLRDRLIKLIAPFPLDTGHNINKAYKSVISEYPEIISHKQFTEITKTTSEPSMIAHLILENSGNWQERYSKNKNRGPFRLSQALQII